MFQQLSIFQRWVLVLFLLQFIPYILLWDDSYIRIHDTLEGEWIWYQILFESGELFNFSKDALVEQVMNGLPRQAYHTGLSFHVIWIGLFGLYGGYVFNYFLTHLIAFLAMILLLKTHFLKRDDQQDIVWGVALCFAWVPFYSAFGLTVAGQPLVLWAAMNILSGNKKWFSYVLILAFPLYSSLVWIAPPMLVGFGCMCLYRVIRHREWHFDFVLLLMGLAISFFIGELAFVELDIHAR